MELNVRKYLDVFLEESREHLRNLNSGLLELEKNPRETSGLKEIFRSAHTLKGMSSTMGFDKMADLTHHMENLLSDLKDGKILANIRVVDVLFECIDRLQIMIDNISQGNNPGENIIDLIKTLETIRTGQIETAAAETNAATEMTATQEIINTGDTMPPLTLSEMVFNQYEISILREAIKQGYKTHYIKVGVAPGSMMKTVRAFMVFKVLEEGGEIIKSYPAAQELDEGKYDDHFELIYVCRGDAEAIMAKINQISEVKLLHNYSLDPTALTVPEPAETTVYQAEDAGTSDIAHNPQIPHAKHTIRIDIERLDSLMNLVGELVMHKGHLEQNSSVYKLKELNSTIEQLSRVTTDLQSLVMKMRMVPIEQVFNRFPRMIRDLAKELGKDVDFQIEGKETELDRTIIDEIGDPLLHLLRNAIDHGIESSQERMQHGKPSQGKLYLRARHEGNNVFIEVEDDGRGINLDKVRERALEKGLMNKLESEQLSDREISLLIFEAGFSTASVVTDVSGRGVGLDVVKSKIEAINGEIILQTKPGAGSLFKIKLPLTLAIIQALMVSIQNEYYAIPLISVDETTMITPGDINIIQGQEFISLRGSILPLLRLAHLLEVPGEVIEPEELYVVVLHKGDRQVGLVVDTLIGQKEIVIKSLGSMLNNIPGIAGAIISGDGNVCLILDIATLF